MTKPKRPTKALDEINTPEHDEVMIWLDQQAGEIVKKIVEWNPQWRTESDSKLGKPPKKPPLMVKTTWLVTIEKNKKTVQIDMMVNFKNYHLRQEVDYSNNKLERYWEVSEQPVVPIYFDVKVALPSLGELIRQVRIYQEFTKSPIYIVSPDDKYADQLLAQDIGFVKFPEGSVSLSLSLDSIY